MTEFKSEECLQKVRCPVLLIQGNPKLAGVMTSEAVIQALNYLPHGFHAYIKNVGHYLQLDNSESILQVISNFLDMLSV